MAKKKATKKVNSTLNMITTRAKSLYATGKIKKWTDAVKKASAELKKEGKI